MGAADFVRNLLLGSFKSEDEAVQMYKKHWLPIEKAAAAASVRSCNSNIAEVLENMLRAFLDAQPEKPQKAVGQTPTLSVIVGGELYPRFRKWVTAALAIDSNASADYAEGVLERKTAALLQRLQTFAVDYFEGASERNTMPPCGPPASKRAFTSGLQACITKNGAPANKWRCRRCSFPNAAGASHCTTCSLPNAIEGY
jgi:hypothetical protein